MRHIHDIVERYFSVFTIFYLYHSQSLITAIVHLVHIRSSLFRIITVLLPYYYRIITVLLPYYYRIITVLLPYYYRIITVVVTIKCARNAHSHAQYIPVRGARCALLLSQFCFDRHL